MKKTIQKTYNKYGDFVFSCAVPHLLNVGIKTLKKIDLEAVCEKIVKDTPENALVSGDVKADILRCAVELANVPANDLLKYVQTDMNFFGVKVHPGRVVQFKERKTGKIIMNAVLPADTTNEQIDMLQSNLDRNASKGNLWNPKRIATESINEAGIHWDYPYPDDEITF